MKQSSYIRLLPLMGVVMLSMAAPAWAGSSVTPLAVDLKSSDDTGQVTLSNSGDRPMLVQAEVVSWRQQDGDDLREPSSAFTIAPAIIEIPPQSEQVFRIRHRGAFPTTELAYRLHLEDITPPAKSGGVAYRVKHDMPLMITPPGAEPETTIVRCPEEAACVQVRNDGSAHVKVGSLAVHGQNWHREVPVNGTVLAGAWKQWRFAMPEGAEGPVRVTAITSSGSVSGQWTFSVH